MAAIRAAQLGARVTVVEHQRLGGVCLNWGCIPSKALLSVIELGEKVKRACDSGMTVMGPVGYDPVRMVSRKNKVVEGLVKGLATLFKAWNIEYIDGTGELLDATSLRVAKRDGTALTIRADAIIIATGSSWPQLPQFPVDGQQIITSKEAFELASIPKRLLIVGGGVEGCELATLYSGLGTQVMLVELMEQILPQEDEEIAAIQARELAKRGVEIRVGTAVQHLERRPGSVRATLQDGSMIEAEQVLVSVGRRCNSVGIGLEKAGVQVGPRGEIVVNDRMETNVPGIYAIGDVVGKAMLAHVASAQGKVAVHNILGRASSINYNVVPLGIFTLPEIGRVGLTERQAREKLLADGRNPDSDLRVGRFRYPALGKAQVMGETTGLVKMVSDARTETILGVHIIGAHATELVHEAAMAMHLGATPRHMADMIHAHPTLSEALMEAADDLEGLAIHVARKRAEG